MAKDSETEGRKEDDFSKKVVNTELFLIEILHKVREQPMKSLCGQKRFCIVLLPPCLAGRNMCSSLLDVNKTESRFPELCSSWGGEERAADRCISEYVYVRWRKCCEGKQGRATDLHVGVRGDPLR